MKHNSSLSCA